jgi:tetratricopeptide (TPR) repeat protein
LKNNTFKTILLLGIFTLLFYIQPLKAQFAIMRSDADSLVLLGTSYIYNIQFTEATDCFGKVINMYPNHPVGYFLDAMVEWWKIWLYSNTEEYDALFLKKIQKVLDVSEAILDTNAFDINALFFKGGALGYRGRYYAIRKVWLKAASDGNTAYEILKRCQSIAPGNHDIMLGTGIYNYFSVKLPEEYPILKTIATFLPKGDLRLGILQLQAASRWARYASVEAKVVLLQIYYQYENNIDKTFEVATELNTKYPRNPYFHRYMGRCYVSQGNMQKSEVLWRDVLKRYMDKWPGYDVYAARESLYYVAYSLSTRGAYDESLQYFYKCDEACRKLDKEPSGFMVNLNLRIGNIYDIQGKRDYAKMQYNKVLGMKEWQNSHDKAKQYLQRPYGS